MTREQLQKLMEWVDARIAENAASSSSDGCILDYLRRDEIEQELLAMFKEENADD